MMRSPVTVIVGHYGVGKTNFTLNLALDAAAQGMQVTVADLDIVNPYFRSSDHTALLEENGVKMIAPVFAGTTQETPALSGKVSVAIGEAACGRTHLILDAGGDDVGATALGRFSQEIEEAGYSMLYVINAYRNLTATPDEAVAILGEIEGKCHLKATGIVNNSHLKQDTAEETILSALPFAQGVADMLGLPLACTTVPKELFDQKNTRFAQANLGENGYPVEVYVRTPWGS